MRQFGEILGMGLQEIVGEGGREAKTILEFLRERMDGSDRFERRKTLAERLGWKGMACCGATWGISPSTISIMDDVDSEDHNQLAVGPPHQQQSQQQQNEVVDPGRIVDPDTDCDGNISPVPSPVVSGMNLADALAAERQFRTPDLENGSGESNPTRISEPDTPMRVSLMRLLEETDGGDGANDGAEKVMGNETLCCVCMGRKKGAAFIPCGHTFCRVCSRELWLNRGNCPLCNRQILEILDIF